MFDFGKASRIYCAALVCASRTRQCRGIMERRGIAAHRKRASPTCECASMATVTSRCRPRPLPPPTWAALRAAQAPVRCRPSLHSRERCSSGALHTTKGCIPDFTIFFSLSFIIFIILFLIVIQLCLAMYIIVNTNNKSIQRWNTR